MSNRIETFIGMVNKLQNDTDSLTPAQRRGMLGSVTAVLNKIASTVVSVDNLDEAEENVTLINFAKPLFPQLKEDLVARLNAVVENFDKVAEEAASTASNKTTSTETQVKTPRVRKPKAASTGRKGKPVDPNSGRQKILRVIREAGTPLTAGEINERLKAQGTEIKYLHSHISYFKAHGQLVVDDQKRYKISDRYEKQMAAQDATQIEKVEAPQAEVDEATVPQSESEEELTTA